MTNPQTDVLTYAEKLESTGLTREQATTIARGSANMLEEKFETLATKADFKSLETRIERLATKEEMRHLEERMSARMDTLATRSEVQALKSRIDLHTWMLGLIVLTLVVPQLQGWFAL